MCLLQVQKGVSTARPGAVVPGARVLRPVLPVLPGGRGQQQPLLRVQPHPQQREERGPGGDKELGADIQVVPWPPPPLLAVYQSSTRMLEYKTQARSNISRQF